MNLNNIMEWEEEEAPNSTLFNLCGKSVEDTLVEIGNNFLSRGDITFNDFSKQIEGFTRRLFSVPLSRHSELAEHCLLAINRLTYDLSGASTEVVSRTQFLIQQLVAMAILFKLKKLDFTQFEAFAQESLLNFLWRMTSLEDLVWSGEEEEPTFMESLPFLTSLKKFSAEYCTDEIITAVCENCEHLEVVDLMCSSEVTLRCIDSLVGCKNLERVEFSGTRITAAGIIRLLTKSQSKNFKCAGDGVWFPSNFLNLLKAEMVPCRSLPLIWYRGYDVSAENLPLLSKFFPHLECLSLDYLQAIVPNFSCLDCLEKLNTFQICIQRLPKPIEQLYALKCQNLTSLLIHFESQISLTGLVEIGANCPNLTKLSLTRCALIQDVADLTAFDYQKPFQKLESFVFHSSHEVSGSELILRHAASIQSISLAAASEITDITDELLTSILKFNDLAELKSFRSMSASNISVNMLKYLIVNCKKLKDLRYFAPRGNAPKREFELLQNFVTENKYSVNLY